MAETFTYDESHIENKDIVRAYIGDKPNSDDIALLSDQQINLSLSVNDNNILLSRADCHEMLAAAAEKEAYDYSVNMGGSETSMSAARTPASHRQMAKMLRERALEGNSYYQVDEMAYDITDLGADKSLYKKKS